MSSKPKFQGVIVPLVTPFTASGGLDEAAAAKLVDRLAGHGLGVFVLGTTGEAASIPQPMRCQLVKIATGAARGRVPVYAGIGDNCIADTIAAGREYFESGVDAVVAYLPSYYLLQPPEMQRHFEHLSREIPGRLMVYNILQTTHMSIPVETVVRLAELPNIIGFKDSENTPGRPEAIARQLGGRPGFAIYMGTACLSVQALRLGFDGLVPGGGNLVPWLFRDLLAAARAGKWAEAAALQTRLNDIAAIFQKERTLGQSLAAMKTMMAAMGLCQPHMLAPLAPMDEAATKAIRAEMTALELI